MAASIQDSILLFGDSITQGSWEPGVNGFGQRLAHAYMRQMDVLNRGFAGYNTEWAKPVFEKCFAKRDARANVPTVRILTIWFGANDACLPGSGQHVSLEQFVSNLRHMVNMVRSPESEWYSPDTQIILITPTPINTLQWGPFNEARGGTLDREFEVTKGYADAVKDLGAEIGITVLDVWSAFWDAAGHDEKALAGFLSDGLHLTEAGYKIVFDGFMEILTHKWPELLPENRQYTFVPWNDFVEGA